MVFVLSFWKGAGFLIDKNSVFGYSFELFWSFFALKSFFDSVAS